MKKVFKNPIFTFVLGVIICGTTGVLAANYLYKASDVEYNPQDENWNVNNVEEALNDVYDVFVHNSSPLIPTLTSNTSNIFSNIEAYSNAGYTYPLYYAFDNNDSTGLISSQALTEGKYIGYVFNEKHYIENISYKLDGNASTLYTYKIQYYDGNNWIDTSDLLDSETGIYYIKKTCYGVRMYFTGGPQYLHLPGSYGIYFYTIQLNGY